MRPRAELGGVVGALADHRQRGIDVNQAKRPRHEQARAQEPLVHRQQRPHGGDLPEQLLATRAVPPEQTGVASGMNTNIRTIGGSVGSAVMSSIVTAQVFANGLPHERGYTVGFLVLAGTMVLAAIAGLTIPSVSGSRNEERLLKDPVDRGLAIMGA